MSLQKATLSKEEIDQLFTFAKKKYVHYIDLQYEVVDHLASGIEEIQNERPKTTFDQALKEVYGRFPITGFTNLIEQKTKALSSFWRGKFWSFLKEYFKLPRIIFTIALTYSIFALLYYFQFTGIFVGFDYLFIPFVVMFFLRLKNPFNKYEIRSKYLVVLSYSSISYIFNVVPWYIYLPTSSPNRFMTEPITFYPALLFAIFFAVFYILSYGINFVFPVMLKEEIEKNYKHLMFA